MQQLVQCSPALPALPDREELIKIFTLMRHPERIRAADVVRVLFGDNVALNSPDPALLAVRAVYRGQTVLVFGQQKPRGRSYEAAQLLHFGMMRPEGYRHIIALLKEAAKHRWPVITLIDTPGADPSEYSAAELQSWWISRCISAFCTVQTPTISIILGEGGSGGALALQVTDRRFMMQHAMYSVIAPESCGSILYRDHSRTADSLELLRPTAACMQSLGIIDEILPEPPAGALGADPDVLAAIDERLAQALKELQRVEVDQLVRHRSAALRRQMIFSDRPQALQLLRTGRLETDLRRLRVLQVLDLARLASNDATGGIAYGYLQQRLRAQNHEGPLVVLCSPEAGGCGALLGGDEFFANYKACPRCGLGERLSASEWAACLLDDGAYGELDHDLSINDLCGSFCAPAGYQELLRKAELASGHKEALVTGHGAVQGQAVAVALSNFPFIGGSMGVVVGEKFIRVVEYARAHQLPLISLCCSGGARMQEGTLSLMQMARVNMALSGLAADRLPHLSILADPTTGGLLASYATAADVILAERNALVCFAGPRVVELSGMRISPHVLRAEFVHEQGGIHELGRRRDLQRIVARYLQLFARLRGA